MNTQESFKIASSNARKARNINGPCPGAYQGLYDLGYTPGMVMDLLYPVTYGINPGYQVLLAGGEKTPGKASVTLFGAELQLFKY